MVTNIQNSDYDKKIYYKKKKCSNKICKIL